MSLERRVDAKAGYDRWAAGYDAFDNPMVALAVRAFDAAAPPLAGARFLDVGCGTGRNLVRARDAGAALLAGIDGSRGMLDEARAKLGPAAALIEADLAAPWPVLPGPFDVACVTLVFEHFPAVDGLVARIGGQLAPGGVLFVAEMHADLARAGTGAHFEKDGVRHVLPSHAHERAEFAAALAAAGFAAASFEQWRADDHAAAIPKLARHAGKHALLSFVARKEPA